MASIEKRVRDGDVRWSARFRDPTGAQRVRVFDRRVDAAGALGTWSRTLAPGTIGQVLRQVRQILDAALADGLVSSNSAKMIKPPTAPRGQDGLVFSSTVSRWLGHLSPEITYRVYAYLKPDDDLAGREAIAKTMRQVLPHVYPMCTEKGVE